MSNKCGIISVGFNNLVNFERVVTILTPATVAARKSVSDAKDNGRLLDVTMGRKTRSVILFDNKMVMLSALNPQTIRDRGDESEEEKDI